GDALMVEVEDFLAQHKVFEQRRPANASLEAVLIVRDAVAEIVSEIGRSVRIGWGLLLQFAGSAKALFRLMLPCAGAGVVKRILCGRRLRQVGHSFLRGAFRTVRRKRAPNRKRRDEKERSNRGYRP